MSHALSLSLSLSLTHTHTHTHTSHAHTHAYIARTQTHRIARKRSLCRAVHVPRTMPLVPLLKLKLRPRLRTWSWVALIFDFLVLFALAATTTASLTATDRRAARPLTVTRSRAAKSHEAATRTPLPSLSLPLSLSAAIAVRGGKKDGPAAPLGRDDGYHEDSGPPMSGEDEPKSARPTAYSYLEPLGLAEYTARFDEEGYVHPDALKDVGMEELVGTLEIKKGHAVLLKIWLTRRSRAQLLDGFAKRLDKVSMAVPWWFWLFFPSCTICLHFHCTYFEDSASCSESDRLKSMGVN